MLCVPTVLILRLIIYHRARKQFKEFLELSMSRYRNFIDKLRGCVFQSQSYTPHHDEEMTEGETGGSVPYFHADEEQPTPIDARSETSAESEEEQDGNKVKDTN